MNIVGAIKKKKVYVPVLEHPGINFLGERCQTEYQCVKPIDNRNQMNE